MKKIIVSSLQILTVLVALSVGLRAEAADTRYKRTLETYTMPDVFLMDQDGNKVRVKDIMQSKDPVIVEFIFGTCTTICPVLSAGYANLQQKLGDNSKKVRLISISIDPENDSPKVMKEYLKRYKAKPGWMFLTGSRPNVDKVMRAFAAYVPNKMAHYPLTLIKSPGEPKWIRIQGLMSTSEFMEEFLKAGVK